MSTSNMSQYNLLTLSAENMVSNAAYQIVQLDNGNWKAIFEYDLTKDSPDGRDVILYEKEHEDSALFYQLKQCLKETQFYHNDSKDNGNNEDEKKDLLREYLVFIDFKTVFDKKDIDSQNFDDYTSKTREELEGDNGLGYRLRWIFDPTNGLRLSFDGKTWKTFVPFDKSSSMARNSLISFIDKDLKETMDKRLLLDLNFSEIDVATSKYYAYRGLYLSNGYRINQTTLPDASFILNQETVIVIKDMEYQITSEVFTGDKDDKNNADIPWTFFKKANTYMLKSFDGEGLICPEYAAMINSQLKTKYSFKSDSHSFQIRMPFTKGVLHEVDFNKFFEEQLSANDTTLPDQLIIMDAFDKERDLKKAKIILTESMFKCKKWLEKILMIKTNCMEDSHADSYDAMKYFFEKMVFYGHTLYITNTDTRLSSTGQVPLNYQFLSTLAIPPEDFSVLVNNHINQTKKIPESLMRNRNNETQDFNEFEKLDMTDEIGEDDDDKSKKQERLTNIREKCLKALSQNNAFFKESKTRAMIKDEQRSHLDALCIGRLVVSGEQRFLSCDLFELLRFILQNIIHTMNLNHLEQLWLNLQKQRLYSNHFYMPENKLRMKADKYYGFLRNPHLARNEQCALRPYVKANSLHEKYFSHLKGVVMLSCESLVPMALGGADFDGDLVKIVSEPIIVSAIMKGRYFAAKTGSKWNVKKENSLPAIAIPTTTKPPSEITPGSIPFRTVKNTFSNQIGLISNKAVKIARKEYGSDGIAQEDIVIGKCCAGCTIITGLEIDAAKTGNHPKANINALLYVAKKIIKKDQDVFFDTKKSLQTDFYNDYKYYEPIVTEPKGNKTSLSDNRIQELSMYLTKNSKDPFISKIPVYNENDNTAFNIDRLPGEYLRLWMNPDKIKDLFNLPFDLNEHQNVLFKFQKNPNWKHSLDKEKQEKTVKLIEAYKKIRTLARWLNFNRKCAKKNKFIGYVNTILKLQYDSIYQNLPCGVPITEARDRTYVTLETILEDSSEVINAIERLKKIKWQYTEPYQREQVIRSVLGIEADNSIQLAPFIIELLSNFKSRGFMLFYYILKDVQSIFDSNINADSFIEKESLRKELLQDSEEDTNVPLRKKKKTRPDFTAPKDNPYYQELYSILYNCSTRKKLEWHLEILYKCRGILTGIFHDMDTALQYIYCASGKDPQHNFLWNIFTTEELLRNIMEERSTPRL